MSFSSNKNDKSADGSNNLAKKEVSPVREEEKEKKRGGGTPGLCRVYFVEPGFYAKELKRMGRTITPPKKEEKKEEPAIQIFSMEEFTKQINSKDPNNKHETLNLDPSLSDSFGHFLLPYFRTTLEEVAKNNLFEKSIVKHAKFLNPSVCSDISADRDITSSNARFAVTKNGLLVINYLNLTKQQIAELCAVYKSFYGENIILLTVDEEARLGKGYGFTIYFDPCEFLREILPNLTGDVRPTKKADVLPASIRVHCAQLAYQSVRVVKKPTPMEEFTKQINSKDPNDKLETLTLDASLSDAFGHFLVPYFRTPLEELADNRSFEKSIVKHAKFLNPSMCSSFTDHDITPGNSRFAVTKNGLLVISYLNLTKLQIAELCAVYKSFYGENIILLTVDERWGKGYGFTIYFDPCEFLREILPNLTGDVRPTKKADVLPASISIEEAQLAYQPVRFFKKPTPNVAVGKSAEATVEKKEGAGITVKEEKKSSTETTKVAETEAKPNPSLRCG